jgi:HSP20 family protein
MAGVSTREAKAVEPFDPLARFDRLFDEWTHMLPFRRSFSLADWMTDEMIRVDEFQEDGTLVIRAELAGIDPDKDVEVTVTEGMLRIHAERRREEHSEGEGYLRRELRQGSFSRNLPLPRGVTEADIRASYKHGILEIRVPMPEETTPEPTKVPVETA